ncbi:MAG TPA: hypothetical protein VFB66_14605 [Tepidisphaeraceae bacterium]|nr:hypothetical protein [Tepidisphaeraceae bacterium]
MRVGRRACAAAAAERPHVMPQSAFVTPRALYWLAGEKPPERWAVIGALYALILGGFVAGCAVHPGWMLVGLAGMFGLVAFHRRNGRDAVEQLAEQLSQRPSFPADAWGSDHRAAFAAAVGRIIADELAWPNPHFLPDDPLEIVFYCPAGDGGEGLVILDNFEKMFGRDCDFPAVNTFGEFIDRNLATSAA